jgi:hypothetical protein
MILSKFCASFCKLSFPSWTEASVASGLGAYGVVTNVRMHHTCQL